MTIGIPHPGTQQAETGDLRERAGLAEGTALTLPETPRGLVLLTRPQIQELVRADLTGLDLVGELLAECHISATTEDAA
jgi:hypothetical protein